MHNAQCIMHNYAAANTILTSLIIVTTQQYSNKFSTTLAAPIILNSKSSTKE